MMFAVTEFRVMRQKCPSDLSALLMRLGIVQPNWEQGDEMKIAAELDDAITSKLSRLMKSDSVISGYINLLTMGKVKFALSETDNELLERVVANKDAILRGATTPPAAKAPLSATSAPKRSIRRIETTETNIVPLLIGAVVAFAGIGLIATGMAAVGGIAVIVVGGVAVAIGLKGRKVTKEIVSEAPAATVQQVPPTPSSAPFTTDEIKHVLAILDETCRIIKAIR